MIANMSKKGKILFHISVLTIIFMTSFIPASNASEVIFVSPDMSIQDAINRCPSGGVIQLSDGYYSIDEAILILRDNISIKGNGNATVLIPPPEIFSPIVQPAKEGDYSIFVEDSSKFKVGMAVSLLREGPRYESGWHTTVAHIVEISGTEIVLDMPCQADFDPGEGVGLFNFFPMVVIAYAQNIEISDFVIDGMNPHREASFILAGILTYGVNSLTIKNIMINEWYGDGMSIQNSEDVTVENCKVINSGGNGYHPGGCSKNVHFIDCLAEGNKRDGIFFCFGVNNSLVFGCSIIGNGSSGRGYSGIGRLGSGGVNDHDNIIIANFIYENTRYGIHIDGGWRNIIALNICIGNKEGEIVVTSEEANYFLLGNVTE